LEQVENGTAPSCEPSIASQHFTLVVGMLYKLEHPQQCRRYFWDVKIKERPFGKITGFPVLKHK